MMESCYAKAEPGNERVRPKIQQIGNGGPVFLVFAPQESDLKPVLIQSLAY
jgi:hypothetical protein